MKTSNIKFFTNAAGNHCASFSANIVMEYSGTPRARQLGEYPCTLEQWTIQDSKNFLIEWDIKGFDTVAIGIFVKGRKVIDYDGVFDLPAEVIQFLRHLKYDLSEIA